MANKNDEYSHRTSWDQSKSIDDMQRDSLKGIGQFAMDMLVPQSPAEAGAAVALGPFRPAAKAIGALTAMLGYSPDADAAVRQKLLQLIYRGGAGNKALPDELWGTPQRRIAEMYADRRAGQTGEEPFVQQLMVDPFAGRVKHLGLPVSGDQEPMITRARKLKSTDILDQFRKGGLVQMKECACHRR